MRRLLITLTATFAAFALFSTNASADGFDAYVDAMTDFTPMVAEWVADYESTAEAVSLKPALACTDEVDELARRGKTIEADMAGTREIAPRLLDDTHARLQGAVGWMARVADQACGGEYDMLADTDLEREGANAALMHLTAWLAANQDEPRVLPIPAPGNF